MASLPRVTVWAWERREDLRSLRSQNIAVAYLDKTLTIGLVVQTQPRREPLWLPASATRIPVVRIETTQNPLLGVGRADTRINRRSSINLSTRGF